MRFSVPRFFVILLYTPEGGVLCETASLMAGVDGNLLEGSRLRALPPFSAGPDPGPLPWNRLPRRRGCGFINNASACWAPMYVAEPLLREEGFTDVQYVFGYGTEVAKMSREGAIDLGAGLLRGVNVQFRTSTTSAQIPVRTACGVLCSRGQRTDPVGP